MRCETRAVKTVRVMGRTLLETSRFAGRRRRTFMSMGRRGKAAALAVVVCCALVASAAAVGLRLPAVALLAPLPAAPAVDYASGFASDVAPLRHDLVRQLLGLPPLGRTPELSGGGRVHAPTSRSRDDRPHVADWVPTARVTDVHPFTNDAIGDARRISQIPFSATTDNRRASREAGEPSDCSSTGGTAWYQFRATATEDVIANTFGTDHAVHLGIFERSDDGSLRMVDCDTDVGGAAFEQFVAEAGTTYLFQITSQPGGGRLTFNLEPIGRTSLVSAAPSGEAAWPYYSERPSVSDDGRYIAFASYATNLHPDTAHSDCGSLPRGLRHATADLVASAGPLIPCPHVYVRDRLTGAVVVASVSSAGQPAELGAYSPSISGNGRFVAFVSYSPDLVEADTNQEADVFVHDLATRQTERLSMQGSEPEPASAGDQQPESLSLSVDGRYVAFSIRGDLTQPGDRNGRRDVVVYDREQRRAERASVPSTGGDVDGDSYAASISEDGRYVSFLSDAATLVDNDTNGVTDVFVRDRTRGVTERVSVSQSGSEGNGAAGGARVALSGDGRYVVFTSQASNLVAGDTNEAADVFVRDRHRLTTARVSVSSSGQQGTGGSYEPSVSRDGRFVAFTTSSNELAPGGRRRLTRLEGTEFNVEVHDLYVRDLITSTTTYIPVNPRGHLDGEATIRHPWISADGRTIAFEVACVRDFSCGSPGAIAQIWAHDRPARQP